MRFILSPTEGIRNSSGKGFQEEAISKGVGSDSQGLFSRDFEWNRNYCFYWWSYIINSYSWMLFLQLTCMIYSGTPPYNHPVYKTTSLLRPCSFKPNVKTIESFYYFEDPVNATTSLLRPGFYGPTVVALTGSHCNYSLHISNMNVISAHE